MERWRGITPITPTTPHHHSYHTTPPLTHLGGSGGTGSSSGSSNRRGVGSSLWRWRKHCTGGWIGVWIAHHTTPLTHTWAATVSSSHALLEGVGTAAAACGDGDRADNNDCVLSAFDSCIFASHLCTASAAAAAASGGGRCDRHIQQPHQRRRRRRRLSALW